MFVYEKSVTDGLSVENLAIERIRKEFDVSDIECYHTTKEVDKYCHTDIIWKTDKGTCTIDVKSAREMKRNDGKGKRYDGMWFELIGNSGYLGSVTCQVEQLKKYNIEADIKYDYVMCETFDCFNIYRRDELSKRLFDIIKDKPISTENPCIENVPYTRKKWGHHDLSVFVKYNDIQDLLKFKVYKERNNINEINKLVRITTDKWKFFTGSENARLIDISISNYIGLERNTNWVFKIKYAQELKHILDNLLIPYGSENYNYATYRLIKTWISGLDEDIIKEYTAKTSTIPIDSAVFDFNFYNIPLDIKDTCLPYEVSNLRNKIINCNLSNDDVLTIINNYYKGQGTQRKKMNNRFFVIHIPHKPDWKNEIRLETRVEDKKVLFNEYFSNVTKDDIKTYIIKNNDIEYEIKSVLFFVIEQKDGTLFKYVI